MAVEVNPLVLLVSFAGALLVPTLTVYLLLAYRIEEGLAEAKEEIRAVEASTPQSEEEIKSIVEEVLTSEIHEAVVSEVPDLGGAAPAGDRPDLEPGAGVGDVPVPPDPVDREAPGPEAPPSQAGAATGPAGSSTRAPGGAEPGLREEAPPKEATAMSYLVMDDSLTTLHTIEVILKRQGVTQDRIYTAQTAREAIETFKQHRPDVALLDVEMPDRDGLEVARDLHAMDPGTCIILVTSLDAESERIRATLEDLPLHHVAKPVRPGDILDVVEAAKDPGLDPPASPDNDGDDTPPKAPRSRSR